VCDRFEAAGHRTQRTGYDAEDAEGFPYALGHGVGLEVHEDPALGLSGHEPLVAATSWRSSRASGTTGSAGVRYEDLLLVTGTTASRPSRATRTI
jgi:Xaa-Pro aminopeptidase